MKKLVLFSVFLMVFGVFGGAVGGASNCPSSIYYEGNQKLNDDEFIYMNSNEYSKAEKKNDIKEKRKLDDGTGGQGWECDNNYCTTGTFLLAPAGHVFRGRTVGNSQIYSCNGAVMGHDWRLVSLESSCPNNVVTTKVDVVNGSASDSYYKYMVGGYTRLCVQSAQPASAGQCRASDGSLYAVGETIECTALMRQEGVRSAYQECLSSLKWGECVIECNNKLGYVLQGGKCIKKENTVQKCVDSRSSAEGKACCYLPSAIAKWTNNKCVCEDGSKTFDVASKKCVAKSSPTIIPGKFECNPETLRWVAKVQAQYRSNKEIYDLATKIIEYCTGTPAETQFNIYIGQLEGLIGSLEDDAGIVTAPQPVIDTTQMNIATNRINNAASKLNELQQSFGVSAWKTAEGKFNTSRLVSDSVAGVVLGTAGGLITSNVIKKNQIRSGFEDLSCTVGGQVVAEWGDEFSVGIR